MANYAERIDKAAERMAAANTELSDFLDIMEERDLNEDEQADYDSAKAAFERAKATKTEWEDASEREQAATVLEAKASNGKATPKTAERISHIGAEQIYRPDVAERSFFSDWVCAQKNPMGEAAERLRQHDAIQERANSSADFNLPQYIVEDITLYTGRPFTAVLPKFPFVGTNTWTDFQLVTGASVASQVGEGTAFHDSSLAWTDFNFYTETIAGQWTGSVQALELNNGGFTDAAVFTELVKSYNQQVEAQIVSGRGHTTYNELPGVLTISGTNSVTCTAIGATPTTSSQTLINLRTAVGQAKIKISNGVGFVADTAVCSPGVFEWMGQQQGADNRDVFTYGNQNPQNNAGPNSNIYEGQVTNWAGLNWVASAALTGKNKIIVLASSEVHVHEANGGVPVQLRLDQPKGANGQSVLVSRNYIALNSERRKAAISVISGTALPYMELS